MYKKKSSWMKHLDFLIADILGLQISLMIAYMLRMQWQFPWDDIIYRNISGVIIFIHVMVAFFTENYKGILSRGHIMEFKMNFFQISLVELFLFTYLFIAKTSESFSRIILILFWWIAVFVNYAIRIILKYIVRKRLRGTSSFNSVLLVTSDEIAEEVIKRIEQKAYREFRVTSVAIQDVDKIGTEVREVPVVAQTTEQILEYVRTHVVDEIFINLPYGIQLPEKLASGCLDMGVTVHWNLLRTSQMLDGNVGVEQFAGYTVISNSVKFATDRQLFMKRTLDILGGIVGTLVTGILCIFVAPIIKIQSPGPVFFAQTRIGRSGRPFKIYKFRSMYMDAEERKKELMAHNEMDGLMFKMKDDPRIFPFGKFIRKTSIDEFPQFWNVLKGDMSLVGTRPPTEGEFKQYDGHHKMRLAAKPGITGMWQVSGRSDITDFEEVVKLDSEYIQNWNISLDIKILFKTLLVVLKGSGSV